LTAGPNFEALRKVLVDVRGGPQFRCGVMGVVRRLPPGSWKAWRLRSTRTTLAPSPAKRRPVASPIP